MVAWAVVDGQIKIKGFSHFCQTESSFRENSTLTFCPFVILFGGKLKIFIPVFISICFSPDFYICLYLLIELTTKGLSLFIFLSFRFISGQMKEKNLFSTKNFFPIFFVRSISLVFLTPGSLKRFRCHFLQSQAIFFWKILNLFSRIAIYCTLENKNARQKFLETLSFGICLSNSVVVLKMSSFEFSNPGQMKN